MKTWKQIGAVLFAIMVAASAQVHADSAAEMLEKGIYNEDTVGNLDEAIKIYRKVVELGEQAEAVAAKAQFRLAQCLLKKGQRSEATAAFKKIVTDFPNQKDWVTKAKQHLPNALRFQDAPWKNGECLTLEMRLSGGHPIGVVGAYVESAKVDGKDVWKMYVRRFVAGGQNEGTSQVVVDQATNRPLSTSFQHLVLGSAEAKWSDSAIDIKLTKTTGQTELKNVQFDGPAYANDQWFFGFRQLPLKVGYKVTLPLRVAFTGGNPLGMEVSVDRKEQIKTPSGTYECFRVDTNIGQTFWVSTTPERYLVQFEAEGITAKLVRIGNASESTVVTDEAQGFSLSVPPRWIYRSLPSRNEETSSRYQLIAEGFGSVAVRVMDRTLLDDDESTLDAWADSKIERAKTRLGSFEVRSRKSTKAAGLDAITFVADHKIGSNELTSMATLAADDDQALEIGVMAMRGGVANLRPQIDSIIQSIQLK